MIPAGIFADEDLGVTVTWTERIEKRDLLKFVKDANRHVKDLKEKEVEVNTENAGGARSACHDWTAGLQAAC
jgi:hypothetical protein